MGAVWVARFLALAISLCTSFWGAQASPGGHGHAADGTGHKSHAVGAPATSVAVDRVYQVRLLEGMSIVFSPALTALVQGESVRFEVTNAGTALHEFSIGSEAERLAHEEAMRRSPGMIHQDETTISLAPGESGSISWVFAGREEVVFACNIPGHVDAGMVHRVPLVPSLDSPEPVQEPADSPPAGHEHEEHDHQH